MAARSRSSSISAAERTLVAVTALSIAASAACRRRAPDDAPSPARPAASEISHPPAAASASTPPKKRKFELGERAEAVDYALEVSELKPCKDSALAPRKGHVRLGVKLQITGLGEREVPANPFYAKLFDGQRDGYAYSATFGGCQPALKSAHVTRGKAVRGWVTFELPESARGLELTYSPYVLGGPEQALTFSLGR